MASGSVASILLPQVGVTPTDLHHQMGMQRLLLPTSVLWVGDLCVQLSPHTHGGREFCHWGIPPASQLPHVCGGDQPFLHLCPSHQPVCDFFKSLVIILQFC